MDSSSFQPIFLIALSLTITRFESPGLSSEQFLPSFNLTPNVGMQFASPDVKLSEKLWLFSPSATNVSPPNTVGGTDVHHDALTTPGTSNAALVIVSGFLMASVC